MNGSTWSVKNWNGARLAVLLALEEERRERREEDDGLRERAAARGGQPVAEGAVADLVVVLRADDEPRPLRPRELAGDLGDRAVERRVVAVALAGQRDVERVVEAVEPHRVVPPLAQRPEVVRPHLADHERAGRDRVHALGELGEDVPGESSSTAWTASSRSPSIR